MTRMMSDVCEFDGVVDYGTTDYTVNDEFDSPELDLEGNVEYLDKNNTERVMSTQVAIKGKYPYFSQMCFKRKMKIKTQNR